MAQIFTQQIEPGFPACWEGLDLYSAEECTPRLYGVSYGNGNDGVSHIFADFYVRTADPFRLAECAMLDSFGAGKEMQWAAEHVEVEGEADYTISATIYDPPDDDSDRDHSECEDGEDCEGCEMCDPESSWSDANGAWQICEVFPVNESDVRNGRMVYDSLDAAISAEALSLVPAE